MKNYRVELDVYHGPLDLLLYLIRRDELDIHDIPIARITEGYLSFVEVMQGLDLEVAGEFLVMAATLMEMKSALLLPREEVVEGEEGEDLSDPRLELVRQLLEYKKFKDAAGELGERATAQSQRYARSAADIERMREEERAEQEVDLESVQIWDLLDAFGRLMAATLAGKRVHQVYEDDTPIDLYEADILDRAQRERPLTFEQVFAGRQNRLEWVGLFLALLELIRQKLVRVEQEATFGTIYIFALTQDPAEEAVARAMRADARELPGRIDTHKAKHVERVKGVEPVKGGFAEGDEEEASEDDAAREGEGPHHEPPPRHEEHEDREEEFFDTDFTDSH